MRPSVTSPEFIGKVESIGKGSPTEHNSRYDPMACPPPRSSEPEWTAEGCPEFYVVAGPAGSGKSSAIVATGLNDDIDLRLLSRHNYEKCLVDRIAGPKFAKDQCVSIARGLMEFRKTMGLECLCDDDLCLKLVDEAGSLGYRIQVLFMSTGHPETAFGRKLRSGDSWKCFWDDYYNRHRTALGLLDGLLDRADEACVFDNSGPSPTLQLIKKDRKYYVAPDRYQAEWIFGSAPRAFRQKRTYIPDGIPIFKKA